jgi:hypothetical protein
MAAMVKMAPWARRAFKACLGAAVVTGNLVLQGSTAPTVRMAPWARLALRVLKASKEYLELQDCLAMTAKMVLRVLLAFLEPLASTVPLVHRVRLA